METFLSCYFVTESNKSNFNSWRIFFSKRGTKEEGEDYRKGEMKAFLILWKKSDGIHSSPGHNSHLLQRALSSSLMPGLTNSLSPSISDVVNITEFKIEQASYIQVLLE